MKITKTLAIVAAVAMGMAAVVPAFITSAHAAMAMN
jgi:hypothetical protein